MDVKNRRGHRTSLRHRDRAAGRLMGGAMPSSCSRGSDAPRPMVLVDRARQDDPALGGMIRREFITLLGVAAETEADAAYPE